MVYVLREFIILSISSWTQGMQKLEVFFIYLVIYFTRNDPIRVICVNIRHKTYHLPFYWVIPGKRTSQKIIVSDLPLFSIHGICCNRILAMQPIITEYQYTKIKGVAFILWLILPAMTILVHIRHYKSNLPFQ